LLQRDWRVVGISRRSAPLTAPQYSHLPLDLGDVDSLTKTLTTRLGPVVKDGDVSRIALVNNAADVALLGQVDQLEPSRMLKAYAVNVVAPILLIGWILRESPPAVPLRIVNVSSGAAVVPVPGLGAYSATKAGLRIAGMILGAELDARYPTGGPGRDVSIWSYEPGLVETPMARAVRNSSAQTLPSVGWFQQMAADKKLLSPEAPASAIADYIDGDGHPRFSEQRLELG
jgi:benzil reductase ((S)-benzoin forming)